jgi:hypothetical protein
MNGRELVEPSQLLDEDGNLVQVGWARQPLLDANLERAHFYRIRPFQRFRIKRWDYYGVTTPTHYYSFTLADLGYAGQAFAYALQNWVPFLSARKYREVPLHKEARKALDIIWWCDPTRVGATTRVAPCSWGNGAGWGLGASRCG